MLLYEVHKTERPSPRYPERAANTGQSIIAEAVHWFPLYSVLFSAP